MPKSMFRKKLFGYSPAEVSTYITKINSEAALEIEGIERSTAGLKAEIDRLNDEINEKNAEIAVLDELKSKIVALSEENEKYILEIQELKEKLNESEERAETLKND